MYKYFKKISDTKYIPDWKSKVLSGEIIKSPTTSNNSLAPKLSYIGNKWKLFNGSCLKQVKLTYILGTIGSICMEFGANIYIYIYIYI